MSKYAKAWGAFFGSVIGLAAVYGFVPEGSDGAVVTAISALTPVVTSVLGTILAPKNTN